jgi:hypothetical protein
MKTSFSANYALAALIILAVTGCSASPVNTAAPDSQPAA